MEQWKAISGFEGCYEVSNLGRVRSVDRIVINSLGQEKHWKGRILRLKYQKRHKTGKLDARVNLTKHNVKSTFLVSRLVATSWCNGYQDGMTVNHIDGDTLNNKSENLEWISNAENVKHGFETNQYKTQIPCTLINNEKGTIHFRSRSAACRYIGRPDSYLNKCLKHNRPIRSSSGEIYGLV